MLRAAFLGTVLFSILFSALFSSARAVTSICSNRTSVQCVILNATNSERTRAGLASLKADSKCQAMAQSHALDMAVNGFFSHTSPTKGPFKTRSARHRIGGYSGENIAYGQDRFEVVSGWMNSEGHRRNILKAHYTGIGIGYARDSRGRPFYVQCFTSGSS